MGKDADQGRHDVPIHRGRILPVAGVNPSGRRLDPPVIPQDSHGPQQVAAKLARQLPLARRRRPAETLHALTEAVPHERLQRGSASRGHDPLKIGQRCEERRPHVPVILLPKPRGQVQVLADGRQAGEHRGPDVVDQVEPLDGCEDLGRVLGKLRQEIGGVTHPIESVSSLVHDDPVGPPGQLHAGLR